MVMGNKVKAYLPLICPKCHETYEVSTKEVITDYKPITREDGSVYYFFIAVCPYCNSTRQSTLDEKNLQNLRIVRND